MLTFLYAAILILLMIAPVLLIGLYDYRQSQKARLQLAAYFDTTAATYGLHLSSKECLHRSFIGLDARQRKMLVAFRGDDGRNYCRIISLDDLTLCAYRQEMLQTRPGGILQGRQKSRVGRVFLLLKSAMWPETELEFYHRSGEGSSNLAPAQYKAKQWESLIMQTKAQGAEATASLPGTRLGAVVAALAYGGGAVGEMAMQLAVAV